MGASWADRKLKNSRFGVLSSLILCNKNEPFLNRIVMCEGNGFYSTTSDNQFSGWTKKKPQSTPQSQTCTKKRVMVTIWWSAGHVIHYCFLNPGETVTSEKYATGLACFWVLEYNTQKQASPLVHRISCKVVPHWLVPELALGGEALSLSGVQILEAETVTTSPTTTRDCRSSLPGFLSPCNLVKKKTLVGCSFSFVKGLENRILSEVNFQV